MVYTCKADSTKTKSAGFLANSVSVYERMVIRSYEDKYMARLMVAGV